MAISLVPRRRPPREHIRAVAEAIALELRREFPQISHAEVTFETREGEDACLWLAIPADDPTLRRRLLTAAAAKTARHLDEGIAILPQYRLEPRVCEPSGG